MTEKTKSGIGIESPSVPILNPTAVAIHAIETHFADKDFPGLVTTLRELSHISEMRATIADDIHTNTGETPPPAKAENENPFSLFKGANWLKSHLVSLVKSQNFLGATKVLMHHYVDLNFVTTLEFLVGNDYLQKDYAGLYQLLENLVKSKFASKHTPIHVRKGIDMQHEIDPKDPNPSFRYFEELITTFVREGVYGPARDFARYADLLKNFILKQKS